jgi:Subtilase family
VATEGDGKYKHFLIDSRFSRTEGYSGKGRSKKIDVPKQDRQSHATALQLQLDQVRQAMQAMALEADGTIEPLGVQVEFASFPNVELAVGSLDRSRGRIELRNVRSEKGSTLATVFVPVGQLDVFEKLLRDYLRRKVDKNGDPLDNRTLIDAIQHIRTATLRALWTDEPDLFPLDDKKKVSWEIWLPRRPSLSPKHVIERFSRLASGVTIVPGEITFPERIVILACATPAALKRSGTVLNSIAELRRPKETAEFFDSMPPPEQILWVNELLNRTRFVIPGPDVPSVCVLDTGVNRGHPLLVPALAAEDLHAIEPDWGVDDTDGHGTAMAGLALFGNLAPRLEGDSSVEIAHRLESVKLLRRGGDNSRDPRHHGFLTQQAVARVEISASHRSRVFSMAITSDDSRDRGRPSMWSAALDRMASDEVSTTKDGAENSPRLFVVAAGNIRDPDDWKGYPEINEQALILDPAQAWNAVTVGASTELVDLRGIESPDARAIAPRGGLSPFSRTSRDCDDRSPFKPDVLMEGGNAARDTISPFSDPRLSLLTTHHRPFERHLTTTNATSAATALAVRMAAQIQVEYPELWPETIRGLIVHSANWTETIKEQFLPRNRKPKKSDWVSLIRCCGFGIPSLERALWSLGNSTSLVSQEMLVPFRKKKGTISLNEMRLFELPWPKSTLLELGGTAVELRVTLSYFIEPNPSRRGSVSKFHYPSHGLRFEVKRSGETLPTFRGRINAAAEFDEEEREELGQSPDDRAWLLGEKYRYRGSIHSDLWHGTAADLADRHAIAIYPTSGWWKNRTNLKAWNRKARFSLIITISAPDVEADLRTEIAQQIETATEIGW